MRLIRYLCVVCVVMVWNYGYLDGYSKLKMLVVVILN